MAKQVEVITSVERRRRWTAAEKEQLVAASLEPGASISAVAREAGIHPSQLYGWRRQLCARAPGSPASGMMETARDGAAFAAVRLSAEPATAIASPPPALPIAGTIEIDFASGTRMRIAGSADATTLSAAILALTRKDRR